MLVDEMVVGMRVRYPGTGTTGNVVRIENEQGDVFAELDSTHLLYRIDQLVPVESTGEKKYEKRKEDIKKTLEEERKFVSGQEFQEAVKNLDQSCEGGG
ncbi:MAG TPA: DUF2098 domain-containing protein [Methanoregulaceae archaeon]|nr:DUF2098 domain-containing protein [Methanoregulaceae archaeon]